MDYKENDLGFDLEIRGNFFVNSQVYPKQKKVIVSFLEELTPQEITQPKKEKTIDELITTISNQEPVNILNDQDPSRLVQTTVKEIIENDDDKIDWQNGFLQRYYNNSETDYKVESLPERLKLVTENIKKEVHRVKDYEIIYENLAIYEEFLEFAKRYGLSDKDLEYQKKTHLLKDYEIKKDTHDSYDENKHGLLIGYNSESYDQTLISYLQGDIMGYIIALEATGKEENKKIARQTFYEQIIDRTKNPLTPEELVDFNNKMFEIQRQPKQSMKDALGGRFEKKKSIATYYAMKTSNRFIDIMALNPKRMALKRAALQLGYKIKESSTNPDPTTKLKTLVEVIDLITYNINDIIAGFIVFETPSYQNRFNQNKQLLKEFPYLVYEQTKEASKENAKKKIEYTKAEDNVRMYRKTINSTSTQLTTDIIAPYKNTKIKDNPTLNLTYPSEHFAEKRHKEGTLPPLFEGKAMNVLDYIQKLINKNFKSECTPEVFAEIQENFDKIKAFYNTFVGKNFNDELEIGKDTDQPFTDKNSMERELLIKYVTSEPYFETKYGEKLASFVKMSIGGIHGVEILYELYQKDIYDYEHSTQTIEDLLEYHKKNDDPTLTIDQLPTFIVNMMPDKPFAHVKRMVLPVNDHFTYGDILHSSSNRKKPENAKFKLFEKPNIFDKQGKIKARYVYTSTGKCGHEDFDSYYPAIISNLEIFMNSDGEDIFTTGLYHPRLELKRKLKDPTLSEIEKILIDLRQNSLKLCINAASGGGDATFSTNIKCNNKMMAMRIIGQLFCWYIGQSLAIYNARIPSSNTDGLYSMNIDIEKNKKIVKRCSEEIMLSIEAEELDLFVSKDSNNRLEMEHGKITSARGSNLTSWRGPSTDASLDHPPITDWILANYLAFKKDACDKSFDTKFCQKLFHDFVIDTKLSTFEKLKYLQFPIISNEKKLKFAFLTDIDNPENFETLNQINRIFMVKRKYSNKTIKFAGVGAVKPESVKKRLKDGVIFQTNYLRDIISIDPIANAVIKKSAMQEDYDLLFDQPYNPKTTVIEEKPRDIKITKINNLPTDQPVLLNNEDLSEVTDEEFAEFVKKLDFNALLNIVEDKFTKSWQNNLIKEKEKALMLEQKQLKKEKAKQKKELEKQNKKANKKKG